MAISLILSRLTSSSPVASDARPDIYNPVLVKTHSITIVFLAFVFERNRRHLQLRGRTGVGITRMQYCSQVDFSHGYCTRNARKERYLEPTRAAVSLRTVQALHHHLGKPMPIEPSGYETRGAKV